MKQLKIGIIGAGRIGNVHAQSITYAIPEAEVAAEEAASTEPTGDGPSE